MRDDRYDGAMVWSDLKVSRAILELMRAETGSQWRCFNRGAELDGDLEHVTTRASVF